VLFISLDSNTSTTPTAWRERGRSLLHGSGANRWFDKSINLVVRAVFDFFRVSTVT
jgi:hypothetical protein